MRGGSPMRLSHSLPLPSARLCSPPPSLFLFPPALIEVGELVIFMHHLGRQDGRTSSNYVKQTKPRLLEKLPLYLSWRNQKAGWEQNGFKTHFNRRLGSPQRAGSTWIMSRSKHRSEDRTFRLLYVENVTIKTVTFKVDFFLRHKCMSKIVKIILLLLF